jgi:hypothetical protein
MNGMRNMYGIRCIVLQTSTPALPDITTASRCVHAYVFTRFLYLRMFLPGAQASMPEIYFSLSELPQADQEVTAVSHVGMTFWLHSFENYLETFYDWENKAFWVREGYRRLGEGHDWRFDILFSSHCVLKVLRSGHTLAIEFEAFGLLQRYPSAVVPYISSA